MNTPKDSTAERTPGSLHPVGSAAEMEHREQLVRRLYNLVTEHHELRVMREEFCQCPVCILPENRRLMQEARDAFHTPNVSDQRGRVADSQPVERQKLEAELDKCKETVTEMAKHIVALEDEMKRLHEFYDRARREVDRLREWRDALKAYDNIHTEANWTRLKLAEAECAKPLIVAEA
jgi:hypothetical protein